MTKGYSHVMQELEYQPSTSFNMAAIIKKHYDHFLSKAVHLKTKRLNMLHALWLVLHQLSNAQLHTLKMMKLLVLFVVPKCLLKT